MGPLASQRRPGRRDGIATLEQRQDDLGTDVLPPSIMDRYEVVIAPDAQPMEDVPRRIEQRVLRMRRRDRGDVDASSFAIAPALLAKEAWVAEPPASPTLALAVGVGLAPVPKVGRLPSQEPPSGGPDLGATALGVTVPIARLALARATPLGIWVVARRRAGLMDSESKTTGEGPTAGRARFSRHGLRSGRPPRPDTGSDHLGEDVARRATSGCWGTWGDDTRLAEPRGCVRSIGGIAMDRGSGRRPSSPTDFPPTKPIWDSTVRPYHGSDRWAGPAGPGAQRPAVTTACASAMRRSSSSQSTGTSR